jgi:hypothetical protein
MCDSWMQVPLSARKRHFLREQFNLSQFEIGRSHGPRAPQLVIIHHSISRRTISTAVVDEFLISIRSVAIWAFESALKGFVESLTVKLQFDSILWSVPFACKSLHLTLSLNKFEKQNKNTYRWVRVIDSRYEYSPSRPEICFLKIFFKGEFAVKSLMILKSVQKSRFCCPYTPISERVATSHCLFVRRRYVR